MKVTKNKVVALEYVLKVKGEQVDKATADKPLEFIQGTGSLLPLFEQNIEGKDVGDAFAFTLSPADGYGEWHLENIVDLPKAAFEIDGQLREDLLFVGNVIPLMNQAGGVIPGKVLEIGADSVKMDLNHPMAGKTLDFTGKILSVRDATEKELTEGLHGEFAGSHRCSCHGGCHEGNCGEDGCEGGCHGGEGGHEGGCCHNGEGEGHECHHEGGHKGGCCHKNQ